MHAEVIKAVCDVIRLDSRPDLGPSAVIDYLMDRLFYGEFRMFEQVASSEQGDVVNLIGFKGPATTEGPLWLAASILTPASPVPSAWSSSGGDPLAGVVDRTAGVVRGLGANSGKVDLIIKLLAASRFNAEDLRRPVCVVALSGAEDRPSGVPALLELPHIRPAAALVGAPTNLELWTDHPGCLRLELQVNRTLRHRRMPPCQGFFEVRWQGRSAHPQTPTLGDDAIELGRQILTSLRAEGDLRILHFEAGDRGLRVPGAGRMLVATRYPGLPTFPDGVEVTPVPDGASVPFPVDALFTSWHQAREAGIAAISEQLGLGRTAPAARPRVSIHTESLVTDRDTVKGIVTFWTGPAVDQRALVEAFAHAAQRRLTGQEEISLEIDVIQERPSFSSAATSADLLTSSVTALSGAGVPPVSSGGRITTDAGELVRHGVPTLVFGPGRGAGDLHRDDESIPIAHIERAYDFYVNAIREICGS